MDKGYNENWELICIRRRQLEAIMTDRVGQRLGNYSLVRKIGQGGFAEVYLGQHIYLDTFAAIKVLHARLESDDVEYFLT